MNKAQIIFLIYLGIGVLVFGEAMSFHKGRHIHPVSDQAAAVLSGLVWPAYFSYRLFHGMYDPKGTDNES